MHLKYLFLAISISFVLASCTEQQPQPPKQDANSAPETQPSQEIPDAPVTPPTPENESPDASSATTTTASSNASGMSHFERMEQAALSGDYISQRNLAYTLATSLPRNPILGCAWRIVIVESGSPKVDQSDTGNLSFDCGKLNPVELSAAQAQAKKIQEKLQKK